MFVLAGYGYDVLDYCCESEKEEQTGHGKTAPGNGDGCQCLCHKVFSNDSGKPVRLPVLMLVLQTAGLSADEFPPDTEPEGIDHPPQIA